MLEQRFEKDLINSYHVLLSKVSVYFYINIETTSIITKLKKSDVNTNIDKYRVTTNITSYNNITKLIL